MQDTYDQLRILRSRLRDSDRYMCSVANRHGLYKAKNTIQEAVNREYTKHNLYQRSDHPALICVWEWITGKFPARENNYWSEYIEWRTRWFNNLIEKYRIEHEVEDLP